ncbi:HNH endonuclease [Pseudonocardia phyllosphaerae]|uniref:HNH endonuclease n=1 Tax=Pseudonocardia phyllosphaerae TaxID=3390502 RepID=UPI00397CAE52
MAIPELLTDEQVLDVMEAASRVGRWVSAVLTRMTGELVGRHPPGSRAAPPGAAEWAEADVSRWLPDQVAMALGISADQASNQMSVAKRFVEVLPETLDEWEAGRISERAALAIAELTAVLDDEQARAVQARVLPGALTASPTQLRARVRRAVTNVDPDGAQRRQRRSLSERRVTVQPGEDGTASLWVFGSAEQTEASYRSLDRLARSLGTEDPRTLAQRRSDLAHQLLQGTIAITDLSAVRSAVDEVLSGRTGDGRGPGAAVPATGATGVVATAIEAADAVAAASGATSVSGAIPDGGAPWRGSAGVSDEVVAAAVAEVLARKPDPNDVIGRRPLIKVVVPLDTLLGGDGSGEILGHGPISPLAARALAAGGVLQRLVVDPLSGTVLDHGRDTYRPPVGLRDFVHAREGDACRGPRCSRPLRDLDHFLPWGGDGVTADHNLHGLCVHHHKLKDVPGWQVISEPDGGLTWVSPDGRRTTTYPFDYSDFAGEDYPRSDQRLLDAMEAPGAGGVRSDVTTGDSRLRSEVTADDDDASDAPPF